MRTAKVNPTSAIAKRETGMAGMVRSLPDRKAIQQGIQRHALPLGAVLIIGGILRLIWPGASEFASNQAGLIAMGRSAATFHSFIITGIISSIDTLNPPLSTWLYAPFGLLPGAIGSVASMIFTALVNVLGIGLLYAVVTRYAGRLAGFVAALLYATAGMSVYYSRFAWQQNLLPPILLSFFWVILAAVVDGKRGWLGWAAFWWAFAFQLHPTSVTLLAILALAIAFTWRTIRWRDIAWAVGVWGVMFFPTIIWEILSHGSDIPKYIKAFTGHSVIDTTFFQYYVTMISPLGPNALGDASSYTTIGYALQPLGWLMVGLSLISGAWLVLCVFGDVVIRLRREGLTSLTHSWQEITDTPRWRLAALLLFWQFVFVALFFHHSHDFPIHYMLVLLPAIYITIGVWAAAVSRWLEQFLRNRDARWAVAAPVAMAGLTLVVAAVQTIGVIAQISTVESGVYGTHGATANIGISLSSMQQTLAEAEAAAVNAHANLAIASTDTNLESYGYLSLTDPLPSSIYGSYSQNSCVLAPSSGSAAPLVTMAMPGTQAYSELPLMTGVHALGTLATQGSEPFTLYSLAPGAGVEGEKPERVTGQNGPELAGATYIPASKNSKSSYLALRWTSLPYQKATSQRANFWNGQSPNGSLIANYFITAQQVDRSGKSIGVALSAKCGSVEWSSAIDILTWLTLPKSAAHANETWKVTIGVAPVTVSRPHIGPLKFETGAVAFNTRSIKLKQTMTVTV